MATLLSLSVLLLASAFICNSAMDQNAKRAAFIEKAVAQARREYDTQHLVSAQVGNMPSVQKLARAFKTPSPEAIAQGTAQLKFERMVKLAEKQIIEDKRQAVGQSAEQLAESFAEEVYHVPGSLLTAQEVYRLYEYSGCSDFVSDCMECDGDFDDMWRRSDGTCNNVRYPFYGAAGTMMSRLIEAYYEDGVSRPRGFLQMRGFMGADRFGPPNPSPRVVSVKVIKDRPRDDPNFTLMLMQWGQFMDHDLDAMPEYGSECAHTCDISDDEDAACLPFPVRPNDLNVSTVADFCHDFRRSLPACYDVEEPEEGETYLPRQREHFNSITHHIDGSGIYHSASGPLILHLLGENGKLKVTDEFDPIYTLPEGTFQPLLPITTDRTVIGDLGMGCPDVVAPCFLAGDFRANEQPGLSTMHTLWVREHNRVAGLLFQPDSECVDRRQELIDNSPDGTGPIFNTARNHIVSVIQKITYYDFLPKVLGEEFYNEEVGVYQGYNEEEYRNIPNVFAAAVFRYGHSQVQPMFWRTDVDYNNLPGVDGVIELNEAFFQSYSILTSPTLGGIDPILRGLISNPARAVDEFINTVLTQQLFTDDPTRVGMDLASLNIMRGRDHGLPPYIRWRDWALNECPSIGTITYRSSTTQALLNMLYGGEESIDLFVGALSETPVFGGLVGGTMACVMARTFQRLRDADWFYFENEEVYTHEQIQVVMDTTLAKVICRNTEQNFETIPRDVFDLHSATVDCSMLHTPLDDNELKQHWSCDKFVTPKTTRSYSCHHHEPAEAKVSGIDSFLPVLKKILAKIKYCKCDDAEMTTAPPVVTTPPPPVDLTDEEVMERLEALLKKVKRKK